MFKKLIPVSALVTLLFSLLPMTAFAAAPTVVLSNSITGRTAVKDSDNVVITATFTGTDPIDETPANEPKITISNTTVSAVTMTKVSNLVWTYTWDVPSTNATAVVSITARDTSSNLNTAATGVTTYTIDNTAPIVIANSLTTSDVTPALSGTVTDATATTVAVTVKNSSTTYGPYNASVNGSSWAVFDNVVTALTTGTYDVVLHAVDAAGNSTDYTGTGRLVIAPGLTATLTVASTYEPISTNSDGDTQDLTVAYTVAETADSVSVRVLNSQNEEVENLGSKTNTSSGNFTWDGQDGSDLVEPGTYQIQLTADKSGYTETVKTTNVIVEYRNTDKPDINSLKIDPTSFDPDNGDAATISFDTDTDNYVTIEIRDNSGDTVRKFSSYENEQPSDASISEDWDGTDDSGDVVTEGTYKAVIVARNNYGVTTASASVTVNNTGTTLPTSNSHITSIDFDPSDFNPVEDEEISITFNIEKDDTDLKAYIIGQGENINIYDETGLDAEDDVEVTWDGTNDDGDYVKAGRYRVQFESTVGSTKLKAAEYFDVEYTNPNIDTVYVSKDKIDSTRDEVTYVMFKTDADAVVTVDLMKGSKTEETLEEDMEVVKNEWNAVEWESSDDYDSNDNLSFKVIAKNKGNSSTSKNKKISFDVADDTDSSGKANVTNDVMTPVVTDGDSDMELNFSMDKSAPVTVTIYKGKGTSGSKVVTLVTNKLYDSGEITIDWNGKNSSGDKLSSGLYTYKIETKKSSTESEVGYFLVGKVGDVANGGSSSSGSGSNNNSSTARCAEFSDVLESSSTCAAIQWTRDQGIFSGYFDGTFKPNKSISRVEILKVILLASGIYVDTTNTSTTGLGFVDIANDWYTPYIRSAKSLGIFSGDGGMNTARPSANVNRAEALKFAFESLKSNGIFKLTSCTSAYTDTARSSWYFNYACEAKQYGLFTTGNLLNPGQAATRGEMASVLYKLHQKGLL